MNEKETAVIDERLTEAVREKNAMEALINSEGWHLISKYLDAQINIRVKALLEATPTLRGDAVIDGITYVLLQEYRRGSAGMAQFIKDYPQSVLNSAEEMLEEFRRMAPDADEGEE